jgi:hypothetical protein
MRVLLSRQMAGGFTTDAAGSVAPVAKGQDESIAQLVAPAYPIFRTHVGSAITCVGGLAAIVLVVSGGGQRVVAVVLVLLAIVFDMVLSRRRLGGAAAVVLGCGAVAVAGLASPAGGITLLFAAGVRPRDRAALPVAFVSASAVLLLASLAGADLPRLVGAVGLPTVVVVNLLGLLGLRVAASVRTNISRERRIRFSTGERFVDAAAHDEMSSLARALEESAKGLRRAGDDAALRVAVGVERVILVCQRARRGRAYSAFPDIPQAAGPSFSSLMDSWGRLERTPGWWPTLAREFWATTVGSWLDSVRLLHTRDIERVALAGTLYLRAAFLLILPAAAPLTVTGVVPFAENTSPIRDAGWAVGSVWASALALASPWIVAWTVDAERPRIRRMLLGLDSLISTCTILATPAWLSFALFAGPVNWLMRPRWQLRRLTAAVVAALAWFLCSLWLANRLDRPGAAAAELLVGALALGLISNSFGLLFPVVVTHLLFVLPSWKYRTARFRSSAWTARTAQIKDALDDALTVATAERGRSPAAAEAELQVRRARARVEQLATPSTRKPLLRKRRTLSEIARSGLGRAAHDPVHPLRCAVPTFEPPELQDWRCRSWRVANHLEVALARIAAEAVRHGEFEIRARFRLASDASSVNVLVENDLPVDPQVPDSHSGRGSRELTAAIEQVPGGALRRREAIDSALGIPVFVVEFAFGSAAFAANGER